MSESRLLGPAEVRALAARARTCGPTKRLGQNFVHDPNTVRRIVRAAELTPDDVVLEVGPGPRLADAGPAARGGAPSTPSRSTRCSPRGCPPRWPSGPPRSPTGSASTPPTRCACAPPTCPRPAPTALVANLPYNVGVPVVLHLLAELPAAAPRARDGAGRGGRAARRGAGQPGLRGAEREARLVRRGPPGRAGAAGGVLAGARRRLRAARLRPPRPAARRPRGRVRRDRRRLRAAAQGPAVGLGGLGGLPGRGRGRPARGRRRSRAPAPRR